MEYNINSLKTRFKDLGGVINGSHYSTPQSDIGECSVYESMLVAQLANLDSKYASKVSASPDDLESLSSEYERERETIMHELDEYYKNHHDYELITIERVLDHIEKAAKLGVVFGDSVSVSILGQIFVEQGGVINTNNNQTSYTYPNKPESITQLENQLTKVEEEIAYLQSDIATMTPEAKQVLIDSKFRKLIDLKDALKEEIKKHPEYAKTVAILDTIDSVAALDECMERKNIMI